MWNMQNADFTATAVHYAVENEARKAIRKIDGTMPEDLPTPEKSIAQLEKEQMQRLKQKAIDGQLMPAAICELPYEGTKEMLLVDEVDSKAFLAELVEAMYDELFSLQSTHLCNMKQNGYQNAAFGCFSLIPFYAPFFLPR